MSPEDRAKIDAAASLIPISVLTTDEVQAAQLLIYMRMDGDIAELHGEILAEKAQRYDDWLAAGLGLLESYANGVDSL